MVKRKFPPPPDPMIIRHPEAQVFDVVTGYNADMVNLYKTIPAWSGRAGDPNRIQLRAWNPATKRWTFHISQLAVVESMVRQFFPKVQVVDKPDTVMSKLMGTQSQLVDAVFKREVKEKRADVNNLPDIEEMNI